MAVPKTTETRCRAGSVQERQGIQALHKYPHPYIFFLHVTSFLGYSPRLLGNNIVHEKKRCNNLVVIHHTSLTTTQTVDFDTPNR